MAARWQPVRGVLRTQFSIPPLGMPLTAPASGLRGLSARPRFPRGVGAKRDRRSAYWLWTGAAAAEAGEARERWRTAKQPELQKRKGGGKEKEASELANSPGSAESERCGGGEPSDRSYRRGREQSRRKKRPNWQILPAVLRVRAAPMEVHGGADVHLQPVEDPMPEQVDAPEGSCDPRGEPALEQAPVSSCGPMGGTPHWSRKRA
ncbi:uncharacterized protein LOC143166678 [Aptenodytes patagonicus]|uniref:uncharacterized protein LOC143166678 n=1 Tax=Aptenodytes patagonicus TaxID=9234 RepID=UPI003FA04625